VPFAFLGQPFASLAQPFVFLAQPFVFLAQPFGFPAQPLAFLAQLVLNSTATNYLNYPTSAASSWFVPTVPPTKSQAAYSLWYAR
jgi:hypothetical protein